MSAYLLVFNPRNGIPRLELYESAAKMSDSYNGHPNGFVITKKSELAKSKADYALNGHVIPLLDLVDESQLIDG